MSARSPVAALALLFWGWQAGHFFVALLAAVLVEAPRVVPARVSAGVNVARATGQITLALLAALVAGALVFTGGAGTVLVVLDWLPLALLPPLLAQRWAEAPIEVRAFDPRVQGRRSVREAWYADLAWPHASAAVLAAASANRQEPWFYAGVVALAALALWQARPAGRGRALWFPALLVAAGLGYAGHVGLNRLQTIFLETMIELFVDGDARADPYRSTTALGHIGELKLSDAIILRVQPEAGASPPAYLHRASYDAYGAGNWYAREVEFAPVRRDGAPHAWRIADRAPERTRRVAIVRAVEDGRSVLALPGGTVRIEDLAATRLRRNRLGATEAIRDAGVVRYVAEYADDVPRESAPGERDLLVPDSEHDVIERFVGELDLASGPAAARIARVRGFFEARFRYSLYRESGAGSRGMTPLTEFLTVVRAGHCEYFATATALLLRAAGIPARYATGFSVQEWSDLEQAWVVRRRHAHSWVRAWIDGRWVDVDTTPSTWAEAEEAAASFLEPVADLWAWAKLRAARAWAAFLAAGPGRVLGTLVLVALLIALIAWLWRRRGRRAARAGVESAGGIAARGTDSAFYALDRRVAGSPLARGEGEALLPWLERVGPSLREPDRRALERIVWLHYRYRFDPGGDPESVRAALAETVENWLASGSREAASSGRGP